MSVDYQNWRYQDMDLTKAEGQQSSYKWTAKSGLMTLADVVQESENSVTFYHRNPEQTVFDLTVAQQDLAQYKEQMFNPLKNLTFGGRMSGKGLKFTGMYDDVYHHTDYKGWRFESEKPATKHSFSVALHTDNGSVEAWEQALAQTERSVNVAKDRAATRAWWREFWQRSWIEAQGEAQEASRNYTLFRYMLGCNAYGKYPTKFNGGLFTFDPWFVRSDKEEPFTPDYRCWVAVR